MSGLPVACCVLVVANEARSGRTGLDSAGVDRRTKLVAVRRDSILGSRGGGM